jgi:membrane-bound serine protease (ClpP class)
VIDRHDLAIVPYRPNWRSRFLAVITDPSVAYILLMIGFYGVLFELMSPGFIVPGVVGALCLLMGLYALALLPVSYAGLSLMVLGLVFMMAEAFLPSFGALGLGGVIGFVMGSILLFRSEVSGLTVPVSIIASVVIVTIGFVLFVMNMAFRAHRRPVVSGREQLLGKTGRVVASGGRFWLTLEGERWQCVSDTPLQAGQMVAVRRVDGIILRVAPVDKTM